MDREVIERLRGGNIKVSFPAISFMLCDQCAWLVEEERTLNKIDMLVPLATEIYFSWFLRLESQIRVPAQPGSGESSLAGLQTADLLCSHLERKKAPSCLLL